MCALRSALGSGGCTANRRRCSGDGQEGTSISSALVFFSFLVFLFFSFPLVIFLGPQLGDFVKIVLFTVEFKDLRQ